MPDDPEFIDLMKAPESSDSNSPDPDVGAQRRNGIEAFLILVAFAIPFGLLGLALKGHRGGPEILAMAGYSIAITYIASDRYLNSVPWTLLTRQKFLLMHGVALGVVYAITAGAIAIRTQVPSWMLVSGRRGSFFDACYFLVLLVLALCQSFWSGLLD